MPGIPNPSAGESRDDFVSRCMSRLEDTFPDQEQRLAVCFEQWRESKGQSGMSKAARQAEGRLEFIGPVTPRVTKQENGKFKLHDIPIFTLHERQGTNFNAEWMQKAVENQKKNRAAGFLPRIVVGHNDKEGNTEKPAVGALDDLYFDSSDGWLYASYVDVPEKMVEEIKEGAWPGRSLEVYPDDHEITALALLGGSSPYFKMPDIRFGRELTGSKLHYTLEDVPMPGKKDTILDYLDTGDRAGFDERLEAMIRRMIAEAMGKKDAGTVDASGHDDDPRVDAAGHPGESEEEKKKREAMTASANKELLSQYKASEANNKTLQARMIQLEYDRDEEKWSHRYSDLRLPETQLKVQDEVNFIMGLPKEKREEYFLRATKFIPKPNTDALDASHYSASAAKGSEGELAALTAHYEKNKDKFGGDMYAALCDLRLQRARGNGSE